MENNYFFDLFISFWQIILLILKAFLPLFIGLIIAYILNGPVEYIYSKFINSNQYLLGYSSTKGKVFSIILTYSFTFMLLTSIIFAFIVLMLGSLPKGNLLSIMRELYDYVDSSQIMASWLERNFSADMILGALSCFFEFIFNILLGTIASIYLLKDKEYFLSLWQKFLAIILPQKAHGIINETLNEINIIISTFLKGALIDSILISLLSSIILSFLNIKYAVIIGIIGGIFNVIPYFGPLLGMIPAFFVTLTNQGISKAIIAVFSLFLVQQADSNYLYPKIVGTSIGLHPLFVLLSVSVMGYFAGIIGMLIAVPIAGIIQVIVRKWAYSK